MNKLMLLKDVISKFRDNDESMFIGEFSYLQYIIENENSIMGYLSHLYGDLVSSYYDNNSIIDIQYSILSFNIVNNDFFKTLIDTITEALELGNYDVIEEIERNYGLDRNTMVYGSDVHTLVFGANRVVSGNTGSVENTKQIQGLNSSTYRPNEKDTTSYNNYQTETNSDTYTNSDTRQGKTDSNTRDARRDSEKKTVITKDLEGLDNMVLGVWDKMFTNVYLKKLLGYITIGVFS